MVFPLILVALAGLGMTKLSLNAIDRLEKENELTDEEKKFERDEIYKIMHKKKKPKYLKVNINEAIFKPYANNSNNIIEYWIPDNINEINQEENEINQDEENNDKSEDDIEKIKNDLIDDENFFESSPIWKDIKKYFDFDENKNDNYDNDNNENKDINDNNENKDINNNNNNNNNNNEINDINNKNNNDKNDENIDKNDIDNNDNDIKNINVDQKDFSESEIWKDIKDFFHSNDNNNNEKYDDKKITIENNNNKENENINDDNVNKINEKDTNNINNNADNNDNNNSIKENKLDEKNDATIKFHPETLEKKLGELNLDLEDDDNLCLICFDNSRDSVFLNCGHGGVCFTCAVDIYRIHQHCPLCREDIEQIVIVDDLIKQDDTSWIARVVGP